MHFADQYRRISFISNATRGAAILLLPLVLLWTSVAGAQAVGTVQTYAGDVRLERASKAVPVATGMGVLRGDHFTTGAW